MKNFLSILLLLATATSMMLCASSCSELTGGDDENANATLYGTKWYNGDSSLGLEFEKSDFAYFYLDSEALGSGLFSYNASSGKITFEVFHVIAGDPSQEIFEGRSVNIIITDAEVKGNDMKVYFHELSDSETYYMALHKK